MIGSVRAGAGDEVLASEARLVYVEGVEVEVGGMKKRRRW